VRLAPKISSKLDCPIAHALDVVGDHWNMLIVRDLMIFGGVRRFDALCDALEISRNILTERLRKLIERGIVVKQPVAEGGRRMEYRLTEKGWDLMPLMLLLLQWCLEWEESCDVHSYAFVDRENGEPITAGNILSKDGRKLGKGDIRMVPLTDEARDYLLRYKSSES
jgi:DNA-binding HxlR family transcriptional regulator